MGGHRDWLSERKTQREGTRMPTVTARRKAAEREPRDRQREAEEMYETSAAERPRDTDSQ